MITIIHDFISKEEEESILSHIRPSTVVSGTGRNTVTRYGSKLPYNTSIRSKEIPKWLHEVCFRVGNELGKLSAPTPPDSVTINEYLPSQYIDWHIDSPTSGPVISVLSLLSDAEMGMRNPLTKDNQLYTLSVRSLLLLSGEHRTDWEHSIAPVLLHRFSIVFRKGTHVNIQLR